MKLSLVICGIFILGLVGCNKDSGNSAAPAPAKVVHPAEEIKADAQKVMTKEISLEKHGVKFKTTRDYTTLGKKISVDLDKDFAKDYDKAHPEFVTGSDADRAEAMTARELLVDYATATESYVLKYKDPFEKDGEKVQLTEEVRVELELKAEMARKLIDYIDTKYPKKN